jgi:hypothetical protein
MATCICRDASLKCDDLWGVQHKTVRWRAVLFERKRRLQMSCRSCHSENQTLFPSELCIHSPEELGALGKETMMVFPQLLGMPELWLQRIFSFRNSIATTWEERIQCRLARQLRVRAASPQPCRLGTDHFSGRRSPPDTRSDTLRH